MSDFNYDIIIKNINNLMKDNSVTQNMLSQNTGISQPQISKALSENNKAQFTLEQIVRISEYFKVSIDSLIGKEEKKTKKRITNKEICIFLKELIENKLISIIELNIDETEFRRDVPDDIESAHSPHGVTTKYISFYFSNIDQNVCSTLPEDIQIDFYTKYGNKNIRNVEINEFIEFFLAMYEIHKNNNLKTELYETAIQDRIDKLSY